MNGSSDSSSWKNNLCQKTCIIFTNPLPLSPAPPHWQLKVFFWNFHSESLQSQSLFRSFLQCFLKYYLILPLRRLLSDFFNVLPLLFNNLHVPKHQRVNFWVVRWDRSIHRSILKHYREQFVLLCHFPHHYRTTLFSRQLWRVIVGTWCAFSRIRSKVRNPKLGKSPDVGYFRRLLETTERKIKQRSRCRAQWVVILIRWRILKHRCLKYACRNSVLKQKLLNWEEMSEKSPFFRHFPKLSVPWQLCIPVIFQHFLLLLPSSSLVPTLFLLYYYEKCLVQRKMVPFETAANNRV